MKAGLGCPPKEFLTNRVGCVNSLLKREVNHKETTVDRFACAMHDLIKRQANNIRWAVIDKGPYKLHDALSHFVIDFNVWVSMSRAELMR